jgi:hypothetical protein
VSQGGPRSVSAFAILLGLGLLVLPVAASGSVVQSGGVSYVTVKEAVAQHSFKRATAICPKHTSVLGGGEVASTGFKTIDMRQTYPVDGSDSNATPDDGWGTGVYNDSRKPSRITVTASCGDTRVKYVKARVSVKTRHSRVHDLHCPSGLHADSGGVFAKSNHLRLDSTFLKGGAGAAGHVWSSGISAPKPLKATLYAACLKPTPALGSSAGQAPSSDEFTLEASCFGPTRAYGASVATSGTGKDQTINSLSVVAPTHADPHGGVTTAMDFGPKGGNEGMDLESICGPKL